MEKPIRGPVKVEKGYIPGVSDRDNTDKNNSDRPGSKSGMTDGR